MWSKNCGWYLHALSQSGEKFISKIFGTIVFIPSANSEEEFDLSIKLQDNVFVCVDIGGVG